MLSKVLLKKKQHVNKYSSSAVFGTICKCLSTLTL